MLHFKSNMNVTILLFEILSFDKFNNTVKMFKPLEHASTTLMRNNRIDISYSIDILFYG